MAKYLPILILFIAGGCACSTRSCRVEETNPAGQEPGEVNRGTFIEITVEGGGFYGGANPVTENRRVIKNDGTIVIRRKQLYTGDKEEILVIPRGEVEALAKFIRDQGFFQLRNVYDCSSSDGECQERKKKYPPAVPLKIEVAIGEVRKQVTVTVFEEGMVDYPESLDAIVNRIEKVTSQAE